MGAGGVKDDTIVQLEGYKEIKSDILKAPLLDREGKSLDYNQFCKQLRKTDYYVSSNYKKRMAKESKRVWTLHFEKLSANCDVSGFIREEEEQGG